MRRLASLAIGVAALLTMVPIAQVPATAAVSINGATINVNESSQAGRCFSVGFEQLPAGTYKVEMSATYSGASPVIVATLPSPFPRDALCPDPALPYFQNLSWTPTKLGRVELTYCVGAVSQPSTKRCYDPVVVNVVAPATPPPAAIVPSAPQAVRAAVGIGRVKVMWRAPAANGGPAATQYLVKSIPGSQACVTTLLSCTVNGLTHGKKYTFSVAASNAIGNSPAALSPQVKVK